MRVIQRIVHGINGFQQRHGLPGFTYGVIKKYGDDQAGYQAALLAYYGFLSIFPLLLVLTTIVQMVLSSNQHLQERFIHAATTYFPIVGSQLEQNVHTLDKTGVALAIGILFTLYGARGVADAFRNCVNHTWYVPVVKRSGFPGNLFRSLGILVIGGLGLLAAPIISGYAVSAGHGPVFRLAALGLTTAILFGVFLFLIKVSLSVSVGLKDIWVSAAVAAVGLEILQVFGGYILTRQLATLGTLYGTFALVLGLLFWLYLQAQVIVYALEIDTVRAHKLWPRSLDNNQPTAQDQRAHALYVGQHTPEDRS